MGEISSSIYWGLPGPLGFKHRITDAARNARILILSFPQHMPVNPRAAVDKALRDANIYEPLFLSIHDGMNISAEIGAHFTSGNMPAEKLSHHAYGAAHAVVLFAEGVRAQQHCEKYAKEFMKSVTDSNGDVRLVVAIQSGECQSDMQNAEVSVIAFDGGLSASEMQAYVMQRMVSCDGPGSTSLYRHLVTEYASFDPLMAERLSSMDPSALMALPASLDILLGDGLLRWARKDWVAGTVSNVSNEVHPLHEWYEVRHEGKSSAFFKKKSHQRYWRACVKAIIPWLEERREQLLEALRGPLKAMADANGMVEKKIGQKTITIQIDELEVNDIAFFSYSEPSFDSLRLSSLQREAVDVCKKAKKVRDDIAHLRPPQSIQVTDLIKTMDLFISHCNG